MNLLETVNGKYCCNLDNFLELNKGFYLFQYRKR